MNTRKVLLHTIAIAVLLCRLASGQNQSATKPTTLMPKSVVVLKAGKEKEAPSILVREGEKTLKFQFVGTSIFTPKDRLPFTPDNSGFLVDGTIDLSFIDPTMHPATKPISIVTGMRHGTLLNTPKLDETFSAAIADAAINPIAPSEDDKPHIYVVGKAGVAKKPSVAIDPSQIYLTRGTSLAKYKLVPLTADDLKALEIDPTVALFDGPWCFYKCNVGPPPPPAPKKP